jgi:SSS family solute:Na+ symporter
MAEFAAILSTAPFFLLSITTLIVRDIIVPYTKIRDEKRLLMISRFLTLLALVLVMMLSGRSTSILQELLSAGQIKASAAILLIVGLYWKRLTNQAAFWGLLFGGTLATVWHFTGRPWGIEPLWPALISSLTAMAFISLFSKEKISKDYIAFEQKLAMAEANEHKKTHA